ncbi:hypothetical protein CYMTET_7660 [Cymbomonas tetramitiformis]|uniref:Uncharacterized protein n=1 Tax=Cymbomonas tetramitiformis TaxID=36881 RepID=A0AAE0GV15_9CHLO|nr:hypothetical protein CYMTET_7660 [Cymbomonas tetramitiformis]
MQEEEIEFQQMEREEEEALIQAPSVQAIQQEEDASVPQPIEEQLGEDDNEPIQEDEWEVEEEEMRRIQEEEMTLAHEEQQEQRKTQSQSQLEPYQARRDVGMPSQGTEEPQDSQQDIALQVTQEIKLPETHDMSMEAQQDVEDGLNEMVQQQEGA